MISNKNYPSLNVAVLYAVIALISALIVIRYQVTPANSQSLAAPQAPARSTPAGSTHLTASPATLGPTSVLTYTAYMPALSVPPVYKMYMPGISISMPPQTVYGVAMGSIDNGGGLAQARAANVSWIRTAVDWSSVEPTEGSPDWSKASYLDNGLRNIANENINVLLQVVDAPSWAQLYPGFTCGPIKSDKFAAFGQFMYDLVKRYSTPPYQLPYFELGNEPDIDRSIVGDNPFFGCWGDQNDVYYGGRYYGEMLKVVYPMMKLANPNVQVLIGGLLLDCDPRIPVNANTGCRTTARTIPPKFLEGILVDGAGPYFDGVSFHAYDYNNDNVALDINANFNSQLSTTGPVFIAKADYINYLLSKYGVTGKYLINTESAVICGTCANSPLFELNKAIYAAVAYPYAIKTGLKGAIWYSIMGWPGLNTALLSPDFSPLPAYTTFATSRAILEDAAFVRDVNATDVGNAAGVSGLIFDRHGQSIWTLWSLDGPTHAVTLPSAPRYVMDMFGAILPLSDTSHIQVGADTPFVYIVW
jgi:hypothetical protein